MGFFLREEYFMYNDDNDLCKRIKKLGYKTYFYPVDVVHLGGATALKMDIVSKRGTQIEKYQIESQFIYFRKNYWVGTVISNYFFFVLFDLLRILKNSILFRSIHVIKSSISHIMMITNILFKTRFGSRSIH